MNVYVCSICGFDYDEAAGDPARGIAPGTRWEDVPDDWVCPICGADKSLFNRQGSGEEPQQARTAAPSKDSAPAGAQHKQKAIVASNLARGADKQHREEMSDLFTRIADYFEGQSVPEGDSNTALELLKQDLDGDYAGAFAAAREAGDRGALRALTWGEKVSRIQSTLITRYLKEGDAAFEGSNLYVCEACGFIFAGDQAPDICPVCKVPSFKFHQIERGGIV